MVLEGRLAAGSRSTGRVEPDFMDFYSGSLLFFRQSRRSVAALLLLILLPCCCLHALAAKGKVRERALAVVNGVEITQAEVDLVYERSGGQDATPQAADMRRKAILAELVRAEAMAQWAVETGIDAPGQTAVETKLLRRQILAERAARAAQSAVVPLTQKELETILATNPLVFAERRQYTLEEVEITAPDGSLFVRLDGMVRNEGIDLNRAQRVAEEAGAKTGRRVISLGSEGMPKPVMQALASARVGQLFVVQAGPTRGWVLAIRAVVNAPLVGSEAIRVATGIAAEQQRAVAVASRSQDVLSRARISYSEAAVALAPEAPPPAGQAPSPPAAGASASDSTGPVSLADAGNIGLPQGRKGYTRREWARMASVGAAALLAGTLAVFAVFTVVRFGYDRFWLPRLWPFKRPEPTPRLLVIVLEAMLRPPTLTVTQRASRWVVNLGFLCAAAAVAWAFETTTRQVPVWGLVPCAAVGWAMGVLLLYKFAKSSARDATRAWRGVTALGTQGLVLMLAASLRWI